MKPQDLITKLKTVDAETEIEYIVVSEDGEVITVSLAQQAAAMAKFLQQAGFHR